MILVGSLLIGLAQAQSVALKDITIEPQADHWQVTPHYELTLSEAIVDAIQNGIEITFVSEMRLIAEKNWWPDQTLQRTLKHFEVHYFSLSNQYQLKQLDSGEKTFFMTLNGLLEQLTQKTTFNFKHQTGASAVEGRFYLDQRALPSTMQLPILFDPAWSLQSQPVRRRLPVAEKP
ncbi:hypothetical protein GCM10011365_12710 [Marinicella pacifica]|uniref:Uncharacterized protein n=2 Tax=Marinicella pacifica TaxID=1171543 RepID=A0A917FNG9_9GAMM|nr:hypothetical protein GCM10011365_12710 [Marinicella pacifica]